MSVENYKRAYFIGIGGIGMSALARYLLNKGIEVFGYDRTETTLTKTLVSEGMQIHYEDDVKLLPDNIDVVVYTPAIPSDHKQMNWLKDQGYTLYKRSEMLKLILTLSKVIAVAGTHGKTSTSSVLSHIMKGSDVAATCFVGGIMVNYGTNFLYGDSEWVIIEADEYDRSFLRLYPDMAIIQALDPDHLDIYGTGDEMVDSYRQFTKQISDGGTLVVPDHVEEKMSKEWIEELFDRDIDLIVYGENVEIGQGVCVKAMNARALATETEIIVDEEEVSMSIPFAGKHNALNTIGASVIARKMGMSWRDIGDQVASFKGIKRRFEVVYKSGEQIYVDDYAHHPEEIKAMVGSLRKSFPDRKITGVFQPHLYTRTRDFVDGFAAELDKMDEVILLPIYPARELPIDGVTSMMILERMKNENSQLVEKAELVNILKQKEIEVLVTLGAGDIDKLVPQIKEIL